MDPLQLYTLATSIFLTLQALPLLLTPTLLLTLLSHAHDPTPLELYLSRSLSLPLLTLAVVTLLLSGRIPLSSALSAPDGAPYATPTVTVTTAFHAASAFYAYTQYAGTGRAVFTVGVAGYGALAAVGLWCLMFGGGGRLSGTGADQRTSGFPFANAEAEKRKVGRRRV